MNHSNRKEIQATIAEHIAGIMTRLTPNGYGVELRFINETRSDLSNLKKAAVKERIAATSCSNRSKVGTQLKKKLLRPLIYDALDKYGLLERPLLISILTDGYPAGETADKLKQIIYECGNRLQAAGYPRRGTLSFSEGVT